MIDRLISDPLSIRIDFGCNLRLGPKILNVPNPIELLFDTEGMQPRTDHSRSLRADLIDDDASDEVHKGERREQNEDDEEESNRGTPGRTQSLATRSSTANPSYPSAIV